MGQYIETCKANSVHNVPAPRGSVGMPPPPSKKNDCCWEEEDSLCMLSWTGIVTLYMADMASCGLVLLHKYHIISHGGFQSRTQGSLVVQHHGHVATHSFQTVQSVTACSHYNKYSAYWVDHSLSAEVPTSISTCSEWSVIIGYGRSLCYQSDCTRGQLNTQQTLRKAQAWTCDGCGPDWTNHFTMCFCHNGETISQCLSLCL